MALVVETRSPEQLLQRIRDAIDDGSITTWTYDRDGDFTQINYPNKAWLRPTVIENRIVINIIGHRETTLSKRTYAAYHADFMQMLLTLFDEHFVTIRATALMTPRDCT